MTVSIGRPSLYRCDRSDGQDVPTANVPGWNAAVTTQEANAMHRYPYNTGRRCIRCTPIRRYDGRDTGRVAWSGRCVGGWDSVGARLVVHRVGVDRVHPSWT